jgi:hypothetical protein
MAVALLDLLPPVLPPQAEAQRWTAMLRYTAWMQDRTPGICFAPDTLARLVRLGASLDIDTYVGSLEADDEVPPGDDEPPPHPILDAIAGS